jgi:hypothetical protein
MPNTRTFATATSGTRWPQPSKAGATSSYQSVRVRRQGDGQHGRHLLRGKGPSRARRPSSSRRRMSKPSSSPLAAHVCWGSAYEFRRYGELASIPDSEANPASGCRSCRWSATSPRRRTRTRNRPPRLTASGFRDGPKSRHQKSGRSVRGSIASGLLGNAVSTLGEQTLRISFITGLLALVAGHQHQAIRALHIDVFGVGSSATIKS